MTLVLRVLSSFLTSLGRFADKCVKPISQLEKAAQGVAQCEVSATRVVVDDALLRGGKSRRGGHRIANISRNCGQI